MYLNTIWKTSIRFGIIGGGLTIILFLVQYYLDQNPLSQVKYFFDVLLMLLVLFSGIKYFRDVENGGSLKFFQGIGISLVSSLVVSILTSCFLWIFLTKLDPDALGQFKAGLTQYINQNSPEVLESVDQITFDKRIQEIESISVQDVVVKDILIKLFIGLLLSPILSVLLRR